MVARPRQGSPQGGRLQSFLGHPGLAQTRVIGGFEQAANFRHSPVSASLRLGDARMATVAAQPLGFGEFVTGAFGLAVQGVGGGEHCTDARMSRSVIARFFEPDDRFVGSRLQEMHQPNLAIPYDPSNEKAMLFLSSLDAISRLHRRVVAS